MQKYREESKRHIFQVWSCDIRSSAPGWTKNSNFIYSINKLLNPLNFIFIVYDEIDCKYF